MTKDEALKMALEVMRNQGDVSVDEWIATEKAIKEALAQPKQEPVAWAKFSAKGNIIDLLSEPDDDYTPLYTTPPQRTWVGLTGEEIEASKPTRSNDAVVWELAVEWAEAKLKEKNT